MFPSVRANFDPSSPFIAHFHTLSPVFFESHRSSDFRRCSPSRSYRETADYYRRAINLLYPSFRSQLLPSRFSTLAKHPVYSDNSTNGFRLKNITRNACVRTCCTKKHFTKYKI